MGFTASPPYLHWSKLATATPGFPHSAMDLMRGTLKIVTSLPSSGSGFSSVNGISVPSATQRSRTSAV